MKRETIDCYFWSIQHAARYSYPAAEDDALKACLQAARTYRRRPKRPPSKACTPTSSDALITRTCWNSIKVRYELLSGLRRYFVRMFGSTESSRATDLLTWPENVPTPELEDVVSAELDPFEHLCAKEAEEAICQALSELDLEDQRLVKEHYLERQPYQEVRPGWNGSTLRGRVRRALKAVRFHLKEHLTDRHMPWGLQGQWHEDATTAAFEAIYFGCSKATTDAQSVRPNKRNLKKP